MSMSLFLSRIKAGFLPAALLLLAACGGGGGSDGGPPLPPPPDYTGNTNAAVVTAANASKLTANVIGSGNTAGIIGGVSTEGGDATQDQGSGAMHLAQRLNRYVREIAVHAGRTSSALRPVAGVIPIEQTDPCFGGNGSMRISGTLADSGTGTLAVSFNDCLIYPVTVNGPATMRVDAAQVTLSIVPTDSTLSFSVLTLRGPGLSIDARGSLRSLLSTAPFGTETVTANLVLRDNSTGETGETKNLIIVNVTTTPSSFTSNVSSGQVFDQVHGYVDITTPTLLVFNNLNLFPDSGQLLLTGALGGAGNRTIRVTAVNSTLVQLQLDANGDGTVDNTARMKWTELTGPVGADLGDTDGDGMHNSWETFHGLNPNVDDAAGNPDGDAFDNIAEYLAGTDPTP